MFDNLLPATINNEDEDLVNNELKDLPHTSALNFTDYITGYGVNQTVRLYMINKSDSQGNHKFFMLQGPADNSYLTYGDFNFTFQNNFTTDYILEGDDALALKSLFEVYQFNTDDYYSYVDYQPGTNLTNIYMDNLTDSNGLNSYIVLNSTNGEINFTIKASFQDIASGKYIDFLRTNIIAFILNMTYNVSMDANFTLKMKNFYSNEWSNIVDNIEVNNSLGPHDLDMMIINKNLNYIYDFDYDVNTYKNYSGTFSFDGEVGQTGETITFINKTLGNQSSEVNATVGFHDTVLRLQDDSDSNFTAVYNNFTNNAQPTGSIEFWYRTNDTREEASIELIGDTGIITTIFINKSKWYYYNDLDTPTLIPNVAAPENNTWMHVRIDFRCTTAETYSGLSQNRIIVTIDDISSGQLNFRSGGSRTKLEAICFRTKVLDNSAKSKIYIDAVGYYDTHSPYWDPDYSLGDNKQDKQLTEDIAKKSNYCLLNFVFNRTDTEVFNATLFDFNLNSTLVFELDITNTSQVALEFDTKGESSNINGFYAWIRTLDLDLAKNAELNITLYWSNVTIQRTQSNLLNVRMGPDYNKRIDSFIVNYEDYHGDTLAYFSFNSANTANLNLSNYFIVIKSNVSDLVFSLVTIPQYVDSIADHQLEMSDDEGVSWKFARSVRGSLPSGKSDASLFKINVTRGYMPSDFYINDTLNLNIQNITLEDYSIPNPDTSDLQWGLGRWKQHDFIKPIANNTLLQFNISLDWPESIVKDFSFNVTWEAIAYKVENATSFYNTTYNELPNWVLNYTLDLSHSKFNIWNFSELMYIYPQFYIANSLKNPDKENIFGDTAGESSFTENTFFKQLVITSDVINRSDIAGSSGNYLLYLTSPNLIKDMHSYINYNGTLWETRGFMYGDNISVSLDVQNTDLLAPLSGNAQVVLFYPNNTKVPNAQLMSSSGKKEKISILPKETIIIYDFNNLTILNLTQNIPVFGEYKLGFFWKNGSAIGCKSIIIYIDKYEVQIQDCVYYPLLNTNILEGNILNKVLNNYSMLIASVNETTGISHPGYYQVDQEIDHASGTYSYKYNGHTLAVYMDSFKQNETILNPDEKIKFKVSIQNQQTIFDLNVKIKVQLISVANEKWIISENESVTKELKLLGAPGDIKDFEVSLQMPTLETGNIWKGVNAPIRRAGAKTLVSIYIEDKIAGIYESPEYALIVNQTDDLFEGEIISLKEVYNTTSKALLKRFYRDECLYSPNETTFVINVFDRYFISSYSTFRGNYTFKIDSEFDNITTTPDAPKQGLSFAIESSLKTEFGDALENKQVSLYYNNSGTWTKITEKTTNKNGTTSFTVNTQNLLTIEEIMQFKLSWDGDIDILSNETIFDVDIIIETNQMAIYTLDEGDVIYCNTNNSVRFRIENTGDSTFEIITITVDIEGDLPYSIVQVNNILLKRLTPGESIEVILDIEIPNLNKENISISITIQAQNIISGEIFERTSSFTLILLDKPLSDYFLENFWIFMISLIALLLIASLLYRKRIIRKIEAPAQEDTTQKRPRKGRYLKISEIKQEQEVITAKKEEGDKIQKKKVDLDDLLKEKDMHDKK